MPRNLVQPLIDKITFLAHLYNKIIVITHLT